MLTIYHNPDCSNSTGTLEILNEKGIAYEVIEYLKNPLTQEELKEILRKLHLKASQIVRKHEIISLRDAEDDKYTEDEWIELMVKYPILMQRPMVVNGDKAVIARPPERVLEIL